MDDTCHVVTHRHPARACLYKEAEAVVKNRKDDPEVIRRQIKRYLAERCPKKLGLSETGAVLRRTCEETRMLNELWWQEISNGSQRDQVSFQYCLWRLNMSCRFFDGLTRTSPHFRHRPHFG
jgi:hypothetical protein